MSIFTNPTDFGRALDEQVKAKLAALDNNYREFVGKLATDIVERTPVDTGRARAGWMGGLGTAPEADQAATDQTGSVAIGGIQRALVEWRATLGDVFQIANNRPYIRRLENGWSGQAPSGMLSISVADATRRLPQGGV